MSSTSVRSCEPTRLLTRSTSPTRRLPTTCWPFRSPTQRRTPTHFKSSEFIGFLLRRSPRILLRTAHWRRQVFSAKGYSDITTSSKAFTSMQLSMDAFLTPMKTPNPAMQRTASRTAFHFVRVCHLPVDCKRRATALAVADLVSR